ncbi:hypothetical protein C2G38_2220662 [Gigaspora rosea]|uniref:Uncharacterized protein n=1 Tax=Gigaspora rosea TaxID=44941 RepID=A0A397UD56_9GLOM|nr:hypothetical protein C2G38_2220662 [Gigaspora rosea]
MGFCLLGLRLFSGSLSFWWIFVSLVILLVVDFITAFKLLFRGTRDGFTKIHFESYEVKGTDKTLGSYNPISWDKLTEGLRREIEEALESLLLKSLAVSLFETGLSDKY